MASWTEQDVAYLRSKPHFWKHFQDRFGALPDDFQKPVPSDVDIQYLQGNPQYKDAFLKAFGELPEGVSLPEPEPAPVVAEEIEEPAPERDPALDRISSIAADASGRETRDDVPRNRGAEFMARRGVAGLPNAFSTGGAGGWGERNMWEKDPPRLTNLTEEQETFPEPPIRADGQPFWESLPGSAKSFFSSAGAEVKRIIAEGRENEFPPLMTTAQLGEIERARDTARYGASPEVTVDDETGTKSFAMGRGLPGRGVPEGTADEDEDEDSWLDVLVGSTWDSAPALAKMFITGYEARYEANKRVNIFSWVDQLRALAESEGVDLVNSKAIEAIAYSKGITPEDVVEDLAENAVAVLESEEEKIAEMNRWMEELQKVTPKTREGSLKYYAGAITQAGMVMGPAYIGGFMTGMAGGGPVAGTAAVLGIMGTQVYGQRYGQARADGRTHGQASIDALYSTSAELIGESVPTSIILGKGGKTLLRKALTAGASGGMEEIVTETLESLYEVGILDDDMTFGEAMTRLRHAGIIGAGMGVQMSVLMHPLVRDMDSKLLPPEMREFTSAIADHIALMERAADPAQKVTRAEIDASRNRFLEAQKIAKYARENPEFAERLGQTYRDLDAAEKAVAREEKIKGLRDSSHLKSAQQKVQTLRAGINTMKAEALGREAPVAEEAAAETPAEAPAAADPAQMPSIDGETAFSLTQLVTAGANAALPDGQAKKLIELGLAKETAAGGLMLLPEGRRVLTDWKDKRHENVINIGLDIGKQVDALSPDTVKAELANIGAGVVADERQRSSTENTMVVTLDRALTPAELNNLSITLQQEAVGARFGDAGLLEGPQAANWGGAFDPTQFREPTTPRPQAAKKTEIADPDGSIARKKAEEKAASTKVNVDEALAKAIVEAKAKKPNPILEPEKVTVLNKDPVATAEDVATLQAEFEKSPEAFDLRTAELKAEVAQAEVSNPAALQAIEVALDVRERVKAEQEAVGRAEQENAAYAKREARKAKAEAQKNRELDEMIRQQKDAKADEAIALAEFLNKQELEESSPNAIASALKDAFASLEKREQAAKARIKAQMDKPVQGTLFDLGGALAQGSKLYADLVEVGALKVAKGLVRFADWSAEMVGQFGKRITPHLQKIYADSRKAAKDAVGISHRKFKSGPMKGKIVAAPPGAQTMKQLSRLRNETLKKLAKEGEPGRFWYERGGKAVLDSFGGDVATSRLFVGLLALYSAGSTVGANTTAALKVWNQWRAGEDIRGATGIQNRKALEWLETGIEPPGLKISNFYNNLMREIDPANYDVGQGATIDLWMMRAFGYERDKPTDAQYVFSQTEIKKLAKALGWEPQQAQAAIWVAIKARWEMIREAGRREAIKKGHAELVPGGKNGGMILQATGEGKVAAANQKKINALFRRLALRVADNEVKLAVQSTKADYLDELAKHAAIVSWGSTPSSKVGQTLLDATFAEKLEFQAEIERIMINPETGREWLAEWLGVIGNDSFSGIGAWDMNIGATQQNVLLAPPAPPESGRPPEVDPGAKRMLSAYSSMIGWLLKLDAVSWHRPLFTATKRDSNGIDVDMGRQLDAKEVELVYGAIAQHLKDAFGISHEQAIEYAPVPTPYGFRVMNFNDAKRVGRKVVPNYNRKKGEADFHDVVNEAINEVFPLENIKVEYFGAMGELARNDWANNTDGESYASRISEAKNKQVWETFERAKRELAPQIEAARARVEERILARERTGARELDAPVSVDRILAGGADAVAETYGRFGQLTGKDTNDQQKIYDLTRLIESPELVQAVADAYGFKIEYFSFESNPEAGVEFRLPQLKKKGYKDGYVWIYDPRNENGSFKGAVEYTRAWRVSHEIAHGITERFMQAKYGDSKRYGRLGRELEVDRGAEGKQVKVTERALTLKEAQRAVEWEDVTFRAQRIILEQMGVKVTDTQFAHENNINLGDAFYRVLTGDFGNPGDFGFLPADKPADIGKVLTALQSAEQALAADQGRPAAPGIQNWARTTDAEIADAVARARQDGMGQSPDGIGATLDAPRVMLAQSGMAIPRKPANTIRFRDFRPSESRAGGVRKLKVKPETAKVKGEIAMADEFIVDVPLSQLYNATKDVKALRGNKTQAQFEADMMSAGYVGFYQTGKDKKPKGSVTLFEAGLVAGMQSSINRIALDRAAAPKTKSPRVATDNPGGEWLAGKIKQAAEKGSDSRGMPHRFGTSTASLSGPVLMPIDQAAAIPGIMNEQSKVREDSLAWLKNHMDATGRLPLMQDGKSEYAPFIQVDSNGNAWVNEGNHRIMAAKALGWTHIPVEVRWFNGGETVDGKFSPAALTKGHEQMAQKPRLPEKKTKINKLLKRWARTLKSFMSADRGAGLVMVPGTEGTVHLATVRPATAISVDSLTAAMREADRAGVALTLAPVSLGKRTAGEMMRGREGTILRDAGFTIDRDSNHLVRAPGQGTMFSVTRGTNHGKGISLQEANNIAQMMRHQFPRAWMGADIVAVESWEKLPAEIRRGTPDGFSKAGQVEAVFYDPGPLERPQIIIISNNSGSRGEAITAAIHEIVGHYGVRGVLGAGYQNYMDSVWAGFEKEAREAAARNGIKDVDHKDDLKRQNARNKAAEEFIAYLAGEVVSGNKVTPAKIGFWESLVRAFRQALARFGVVDVNARDIAHLIQSAERYARGGVFAVRESRRRDIMMAQAVPEFYSQMIKYVEDKLPNAATPAQYLEQLEAAQRKGEFKKEEFETASIAVILSQADNLTEFPFETWHKDDSGRVRSAMEELLKNGYIARQQMDHFIESGQVGGVLDGAQMRPTKLTKAQLLHLIGKHAANVKWELVGNAAIENVLQQPLHINGDPLVRDSLGRGSRRLSLSSTVEGGRVSTPFEYIAEQAYLSRHLPPVHAGSTVAREAAEFFAEAVHAYHNKKVDNDMRDGPGAGSADAAMLRDVNELAENGSASFYPTAQQALVSPEHAAIFDAIRELFIESDGVAYSRKIEDSSFEGNLDRKRANPATRMRAFDSFWYAHDEMDPNILNGALIRLIRDRHPAVMGLEGLGDLSAAEFLSTHIHIGESPVEIVSSPAWKADPWKDWRGSIEATVWVTKARNRQTGEESPNFAGADKLTTAEQVAALHDWGSGINPASRKPVSNRWIDHTLTEGVNAYQEWLLIDQNPAGRQYQAGHWHKRNAAHLRSGFVVDEASGKLVPIATEIQSDTGQAWQDKKGKPLGPETVRFLMQNSYTLLDKAQGRSLVSDGGDGRHVMRISATGGEASASSTIIGEALIDLFEKHLPDLMTNNAVSLIAETIDGMADGGNPTGAVLRDISRAFAGPFSKQVGEITATLSGIHSNYSKYARRDLEAMIDVIGNDVPPSNKVQMAIASSQREAVRNYLRDIDSILENYDRQKEHGSTSFAGGLLKALSRDDGLDAMHDAIVDISTLLTSSIKLVSTVQLVATNKLNKADGIARAKADLEMPGALMAAENFAFRIRDAIDAIKRAGDELRKQEILDPSWPEVISQSSLSITESMVKFSEARDFLSGNKSLVSAAPSHASTASHQLAAIKKLVAQAVEHGMDYVFFAPAELSMRVAASTGAVIESEATHVKKIHFPYQDWAEMMLDFYTNEQAPSKLDGMSQEDAIAILGIMRGLDSAAAMEGNFSRQEVDSEAGRLVSMPREDALREMRGPQDDAAKEFANKNYGARLFEFMHRDEAGDKALKLKRGEMAAVYYRPRSYMRDNIGKPPQLTSDEVMSMLEDATGSLMAIFPLKENGTFVSQDEVVSQLGHEGLGLLRNMEISETLARLPDGVEMRINWTNTNLGLLQNMSDPFVTARGLRYVYNVMLPNNLKAFAKKYGTEVSLREASPVPGGDAVESMLSEEGALDISSYDSADVNAKLRSWRQDGMMVQPGKARDGTYNPPKLLALKINDKLRSEVQTTGFPMFSVKSESRAGIIDKIDAVEDAPAGTRADRVMGETMTGTGRKFRDFFADVTKGVRQQPRGLERYAPAIQAMASTEAFASVRQKYSGNFENHIMTSIPGYREAQDAIFVAITNTLGKTGGTVLDIGASEGAALKAIAEVNPAIRGVALDPNPEMKKTFDKKGGPKSVKYALAAYGLSKDEGKNAWTEDDGTQIRFFDPKGQKFDVIYEGMVFQFISNERNAQLKRAKDLLAPGGILVIQEKLGGAKAQYDANEAKKDEYKALYYTATELEAKKQEVLQTGGDAVEGMTDLQVSVEEMEAVLKNLFKNVVQIWDSGNFKGYAASDNAARVKAFVDNLQPLRSSYSTVVTPRAVRSHGGVPMMYSIRDGKTGNTLFDSFAAKVGPFGPVRTLKDVWNSFTNRWRDRTIAATLDAFHGQKIAEEALGLNVDEQGYVSMRLAAGSDAVVRAALEYGVPIWKEGASSVDESAGGFLDVLKPLADNPDKMRAWELWMVSRRAERLKGEGREKLFEMGEIREVQAEVDRRGWTQEFEAIATNYADWKKRLMDFAEEAGVINPTTRPLWEHADHIPFYRVLEGDISGPFSGGAIADVKQQIQRLRGSDKAIGDPLQNIFMNMASLIDASMRNHAARLSINNLDGSGLVTKHPQFQITKAAVPLDQLRARLRAVGVDTATLDSAGMRGIESMIAIEAPTGTNVVSYMDGGKRFYYEVHDPLVLQALQGVHPNPWSKMMTLLRAPKRIFTQSITLDPVFMARNWFRDMFHAFTLGRDGAIPVVPGYDSVRGAISSLSKDKKMIEMISGGGAFDSGYVNANDPAGMAKIIRGRLSAAGFVTNMVTGKVKSTFEFYRELSSSMENSHRVMVFEKSRKAGKSLKAAAYEARDLMDFSMRGAHPMIRFIAETTPFWNARLQGLYRTFRVAGPGQAGKAAGVAIAGMLARGSLLTLASVALFFKNREDERWKELNDYEKNMYYHFFDVFEEGDHYALPKPFEIGAMFSTIPEIIAEGMLSTEPDAGKAAARQFYHVIAEALSLAPDVQAVMPIAELAMNRDTFRDSPILTDYDKQLMPEDQDHYRMSPSVRALAHSVPAGAPDALRSPKQLNHLILGYTGTLGSYAVAAVDSLWWRLNEEEAGLPPEKRPDEIVGVRSFVRNQPRKYPRSLSTLYDVLEDADRVYNSMRRAEKEDQLDRWEELESDNIELLLAREAMDEARKEIREINKEIREIHLDKEMRPEEKRRLIDELLQYRNEAAKSVYDWRPGGAENVKEIEMLKRGVEGGDFTGMTKKEQVDTLTGLGLHWTADLVSSVSLSPREASEFSRI